MNTSKSRAIIGFSGYNERTYKSAGAVLVAPSGVTPERLVPMQDQHTFAPPLDSTENVPYGYCHCGCGRKTPIAQRTISCRFVLKGEPFRFCKGHKPLQSVEERFWSNVSRGETCWVWQAASDRKGYGIFTIRGRNRIAPRVAWELTHGPIENGLFVCHACDNPQCVNPSHLFLGTQRDNLRDMDEKGRRGTWSPSGEKNPRARLTQEQVTEIRTLYRRYSRDWGSGALARKYGVGVSTINSVLSGDTWR